ncbi:MAG: hypothetical protein IPK16_13740 [Anaerolineales bacterium]|nr:hypothetical protein [Anaerolineales bacterium]
MLTHRFLRICTVVLTGFVAISAIAGGFAMLVGLDVFPPAWLAGTPFSTYTIPALLLAFVVGGSALVAAVTVARGSKTAGLAAITAGLMLTGYVTVEVLILKQTPPGPTWIEIIFPRIGSGDHRIGRIPCRGSIVWPSGSGQIAQGIESSMSKGSWI